MLENTFSFRILAFLLHHWNSLCASFKPGNMLTTSDKSDSAACKKLAKGLLLQSPVICYGFQELPFQHSEISSLWPLFILFYLSNEASQFNILWPPTCNGIFIYMYQ